MASNENQRLRGVNLGGWLVLEKWITPSLFEGLDANDEYTFMQQSGAAEKIEQHRQKFITEKDFKWLAEHGVNAVRIPIGYWVFDGDEPYSATVSYLDWAMKMAKKHGLKVLIDLHAAKGSQNGKDHSGQIGSARWYNNRTYRDETVAVLTRIAKRYKNNSAFWGIEVLNEPKLGLIRYFQLRHFYRKAYVELRGVVRLGTHIVFSDSFMPGLFYGDIKQKKGYPAVMDVHWYQFGKTRVTRYFKSLAKKSHDIARLQRFQPVIVGEWSGMLSHKTLNGLSKEEQEALQNQHIQRQLQAYGSAQGWFYWTYKTEAGGIWDFRQQVESGSLLLTEEPVLD